MAIHCDHCNILKRGQGGVKIGGRFSLTVVNACPCPSLPSAILLDETLVENAPLDTLASNYAVALYPMRICPADTPALKPWIYDIEVTNYPSGDIAFEGATRVYAGVIEGCTYNDLLPPIAYVNNIDGVIDSTGSFFPPSEYGFLYLYVLVGVVNTAGDWVDPPIINFKYKLSPTL